MDQTIQAIGTILGPFPECVSGILAPLRSTDINLATQLEDLRVPPGNRLHALEGDRKG